MANRSNISHFLGLLLGLEVCARQGHIGVVRLGLRVVDPLFNLGNAFLRTLWFCNRSLVGWQIYSLDRSLTVWIWRGDDTARSGFACIHTLLLFKGGPFLFRGQFTIFSCSCRTNHLLVEGLFGQTPNVKLRYYWNYRSQEAPGVRIPINNRRS